MCFKRNLTGLLFTISLIIFITGISYAENTAADIEFSIIPKPESIKPGNGIFKFIPGSVIIADSNNSEISEIAKYLTEAIKNDAGITLSNVKEGKSAANAIVLKTDPALSEIGNEGYKIFIRSGNITISAFKPAGIFYGVQTLRQIIRNNGGKSIPCAEISDKPVYMWRGVTLDCVRHFLKVDFIKKYIDLLAYHKMNVLHLHLTDDHGWRFEIKKYPLLAEKGQWRNMNGTMYGGFYTQTEMKDIVSYAASRYVMVVPEIEMPGHSSGALAAYPQYSCTGGPIDVTPNWDPTMHLFCPSKEDVYTFIEDILKEVCAIFPSPYIHVGGDEAFKDQWKACPLCQKTIKDKKLKDENELQGYFTHRIDRIVTALGKNMIGWDEILDGGISPNAIVQSWRGTEGAVKGASMGHKVISSPIEYTYFNYPQTARNPETVFMRINTLESAYSFDPAPEGLSDSQKAFVLGGECCMWTELSSQEEIDQSLFPRLCAFSETVWTSQKKRDFSDFASRLKIHFTRLDKLGVDYFKPEIYCIGKWGKDDLKNGRKTFDWDITLHVTNNGHYLIRFENDDHDIPVSIEKAEIFQNGKTTAFSPLIGISADSDTYPSFRFDIKTYRPESVFKLKVTLSGKENSMGTVWMKKFGIKEKEFK